MGERIYDVGIIGGGIVGLATAMALVKAGVASVAILEAEDKLASHQTGNNSGVIHSGLYYKPGSLKALNCVAGREALYRFCREQGIVHEACGKLVVATRRDELPALAALEQKGAANGLKKLRRLDASELREYEPHVAGIAGLWVGETGIVDYKQVCERYAAVIRSGGGEIRLGFRVHGVARDGGELRLSSTAGEVSCRNLVNCAGLHSDRVARLCGVKPGLQIIPFRGEYFKLLPARYGLVRNLVYPVPDPRFPFLGVHFTRMIGGGVEAGPNAVLAFKRHGYKKTSFSLRDAGEFALYPGFWIMGLKFWKMGFGEFYRSFSKRAFVKALQRLLPDIQAEDLEPGGAGVRAQALEANGFLADDFRIREAERMVHVLNAPSPAATASISIGESIAAIALKNFALAGK
ncbi:MAG: L-2-hydroxyglutarate oxidase [Acidobacteria bacterium]|jgi:L-2-hydroxyglutarate oxidase|nr:L-2-hydroxyglutarate oxidase [Acidobacteriota bacterium]